MRYRSGAISLMGLVLMLLASSPSHAQNAMLELSARPVVLPARNAFEDILLFYARQPQLAWGTVGKTNVPRLNMGLSAQGNLFVTRDMAAPEGALEVLGLHSLDVRVSDLPGGQALRPLLGPTPEGASDTLRVRDVGVMLRGPNGPLRSFIRSVLGDSPVAQTVGGGVAAAAILGAVGQLGSQRAGLLGFAPTMSHTVWDGRVRAFAMLNSEPRFKNATVDAMVAVKLPAVFQSALSREDFVEAGLVGWRSPERQMFINSRWAKVRTRTRAFEVALGIRSNRNEPSVWAEAEVITQVKKLGVRSNLLRQMGTGHVQASSALTFQTPTSAFGVYAMVDGQRAHSAGILAMGTF